MTLIKREIFISLFHKVLYKKNTLKENYFKTSTTFTVRQL